MYYKSTIFIKYFLLLLPGFILAISVCDASQQDDVYKKDGLSFKHPSNWVVKEDLQFPGSRRSVSVETPKTSLITIEIYAKDILTSFPEYREYDSSLQQFAIRYNNRDITTKLQTKHPVKQEFIMREGMRGLKETRQFQIGDLVNKTLVIEYYRVDTKDEIVFITMGANQDEYKATSTGFDTILKSFNYQ